MRDMLNSSNGEVPTTDVETALRAGASLADVRHATGDFVLVPQGYELRELDDLKDRPRRICTNHKIGSQESFIDYVNRFKDERSVIFCSLQVTKGITLGGFRAVLDYHRPGAPEWGDHTVEFCPIPSAYWLYWKFYAGKEFSQKAFIELIEDRPEVSAPEVTSLHEMIYNLQITKQVTYEKEIRPDAQGNVTLNYSKSTQGRGDIVLPGKLVIKVPVFEGGMVWEFKARLSFDVSDEGKLSIKYEIVRPELVLQMASDFMLDAIRTDCDLPFYQVA